MSWIPLYVIDIVFYLPCICTVGYMLLFSLASIRKSMIHPVSKGRMSRFMFIVSAIHADQTVLRSVESIMAQDYREQDFDLLVISCGNRPVTNLKLKQHRLTLFTCNATTRGAALQCALEESSSLKLYDMVVILDAGDTVEHDFLSWINRSRQAGYKVIQAHRMTRDITGSMQTMEATFEEINNSVCRRGHTAIGMSSGLATSGTAYDYNWFKANVGQLGNGVKEAEALILSERIFIDYVEEAHVYSLKSKTGEEFSSTRGKWCTAQRDILSRNLRYLLPAIITSRYDYADKIIQWMLVPKTWLVTICCIFSFLWPWLYWSVAVKWWLALMVLFFAFALAVPDYLVDDSWLNHMRRLPILAIKNIWAALPRRIPQKYLSRIKIPYLHRKP